MENHQKSGSDLEFLSRERSLGNNCYGLNFSGEIGLH